MVEVTFEFISGLVFGIEHLQVNNLHATTIDLGICRVVLIYDTHD